MKTVSEIIIIIAILEIAFLLYLLYLKNSIKIENDLPPPPPDHNNYRDGRPWADYYEGRFRQRNRTVRENAHRAIATFIFVLIIIGIFLMMAGGN